MDRFSKELVKLKVIKQAAEDWKKKDIYTDTVIEHHRIESFIDAYQYIKQSHAVNTLGSGGNKSSQLALFDKALSKLKQDHADSTKRTSYDRSGHMFQSVCTFLSEVERIQDLEARLLVAQEEFDTEVKARLTAAHAKQDRLNCTASSVSAVTSGTATPGTSAASTPKVGAPNPSENATLEKSRDRDLCATKTMIDQLDDDFFRLNTLVQELQSKLDTNIGDVIQLKRAVW